MIQARVLRNCKAYWLYIIIILYKISILSRCHGESLVQENHILPDTVLDKTSYKPHHHEKAMTLASMLILGSLISTFGSIGENYAQGWEILGSLPDAVSPNLRMRTYSGV